MDDPDQDQDSPLQDDASRAARELHDAQRVNAALAAALELPPFWPSGAELLVVSNVPQIAIAFVGSELLVINRFKLRRALEVFKRRGFPPVKARFNWDDRTLDFSWSRGWHRGRELKGALRLLSMRVVRSNGNCLGHEKGEVRACDVLQLPRSRQW